MSVTCRNRLRGSRFQVEGILRFLFRFLRFHAGIPALTVLATGMLAKDASFRLIVTGNVGVKEIERLIKKLELDKEILADSEVPDITKDEAAN